MLLLIVVLFQEYFVVWMKVPYNSKEQNLKYAPSTSSNQKCVGSFQFQYVNMLGDTILHGYPMDKSMEGKMLFFPSFPFVDSQMSTEASIFILFMEPLDKEPVEGILGHKSL